jgi:isopentenyldiphosphate isomerase
MELLDIVDDNDNVIGTEDFLRVHSEGLRHRSVHILVFERASDKIIRYPGRLLVAKRGSSMETSPSKLHTSAAGHVKSGQTYLEAAQEEAREELFYNQPALPRTFDLHEISRYKNDTRPTNKENTALFLGYHHGDFSPDPHEIEEVFWQDPEITIKDMELNPDKYTQSFRTALLRYMFKTYSD